MDEVEVAQSKTKPERKSLRPIEGADRRLRRRLDLKAELVLALLPTLTILGVLAEVEVLTSQRLLFASLASSTFLIYLDPQHGTNQIRTLIIAHMGAALVGWGTFLGLSNDYWSAGSAMVITIVLMILLDAVHPPAVATALAFALRAENATNLVLFGMAVGVTVLLVILEKAMLWMLSRVEDYWPHES